MEKSQIAHQLLGDCLAISIKIIIINTKSTIFNETSVIFNTKFIDFNGNGYQCGVLRGGIGAEVTPSEPCATR